MSEIKWNLLKNERLKKTRGISFEEILQSKLISVREHPRLAHQNWMLFWHKGYVWTVPFVQNGEEVFLKTIYPSRKYTKMYHRGQL